MYSLLGWRASIGGDYIRFAPPEAGSVIDCRALSSHRSRPVETEDVKDAEIPMDRADRFPALKALSRRQDVLPKALACGC